MSSSSNSNMAQEINDIKQNMVIFSEVISLIFIVFGAIGHAFNIYIFTRPKFRHNPCVRYFLASALSGYGVVLFTMPLRLLQISFNIDVFTYSMASCKILSYILPCFRVLCSWFIALASIDRFLCSSYSNRLRGWSNLRITSYAILLTVLFIFLSHLHLLFYQTLVIPPRICGFVSSTYQGFYGLFNLVIWSWIPTLCMFICGLLIIRNIRQGRRRVEAQNHLPQHQRKTDRQLMHMLLIQSFIMSSTTTAVSIAYLYVSITSSSIVKNDLHKIKDSYLTNALNYIANTGACMSFYIFTLSSQLFRKELINLLCWKRPTPVINYVSRTTKAN